MPHYVVEPKAEHEASAVRIVDAKNQARALAHVVEDTLTVRLAEPADFVSATKAGVEIEKAP
jgi:hypothetical protein